VSGIRGVVTSLDAIDRHRFETGRSLLSTYRRVIVGAAVIGAAPRGDR